MSNTSIHSNTSSNTNIPQQGFVNTKQWIYEVCEKICSSHTEARFLAFQTTLWLEYLFLNLIPFSIPFDSKYIQLFALVLLNEGIELKKELRARCSRKNLFHLTNNLFSTQEFYKLQGEIEFLNLKNLVKQESPLKELESLFNMLPQITPQIKNISLILLDAYNLQYFLLIVDKKKVAAASISVARFWIYEKQEEKWNEEYTKITGLTLSDFKEEYDKVYSLAFMINQKNLVKKREEEEERKRNEEEKQKEEMENGGSSY